MIRRSLLLCAAGGAILGGLIGWLSWSEFDEPFA